MRLLFVTAAIFAASTLVAPGARAQDNEPLSGASILADGENECVSCPNNRITLILQEVVRFHKAPSGVTQQLESEKEIVEVQGMQCVQRSSSGADNVFTFVMPDDTMDKLKFKKYRAQCSG